jgi:hypothetical protein
VHWGDLDKAIDEAIVPLIQAMWEAGIKTYQSCQDMPSGYVWIQFESSHDVEKFLNIIAKYETVSASLYTRMQHGYNSWPVPQVGQWQYVVVADDLWADEVDAKNGDGQETYDCEPEFMLLIGVHFPQTDLPEVLRRLKRFNGKVTTLANWSKRHSP